MKLFQRIPTTSGPRTIVVQGLTSEAAHAVMSAIMTVGGECHLTEDGPQMSMSAHLRAIRPVATLASAPNVTVLRKRRK